MKKTVKDIELKDKRALIRVDFNVPLDDEGCITDDARIVKSLNTINYCRQQGAKVVLMSHFGRPKGKVKPEYSLRPVAKHLEKLLGISVQFLDDCVGDDTVRETQSLESGSVALLENLRFHEGEEANNPDFAKQLAQNGDVYVNDAFGAAHRAHASTAGVAKFLPAVAGFLIEKELTYFEKAISNPERPFVTILGGSKVSDKIKLITNLLDKADSILIGGAMAYAFYKVLGIGIGDSKFDPKDEPIAREIWELAKTKKVDFVLPIDRVVAQKFEANPPSQIVEGSIPDGWSGFDVGPKTAQKYCEILKQAKTIVWNGPVGVFELPPFHKSSQTIAECIAELDATTIIGGGDTAAAIKKFGLEDKMSHVSTGGGASLKFLEGTELPGVSALMNQEVANL